MATYGAIRTFAEHGMPTTDLLLAQASYYANMRTMERVAASQYRLRFRLARTPTNDCGPCS